MTTTSRTTAMRGGWTATAKATAKSGTGIWAARAASALALPALLTIAACAALLLPGSLLTSGAASAKTPGKTYCFRGICHRVKTLAETRRQVGRRRVMIASFYDSCQRDRFNPCGLTSSGERFKPHKADNAASPIYPNGTLLLVWNPSNRRSVVLRVNNAGPYHGRRLLDVSRAAADRLGFRHRGVARVHVKVLKAPTPAQASYRRNRTYRPAPGYIGVFGSIDAALAGAARAIGGIFTPSTATASAAAPAERKRGAARPTKTRTAAKARKTSRTASRTKRRTRVQQARLERKARSRTRVARASTKQRRQRVANRSSDGWVDRKTWLEAGRRAGRSSGTAARKSSRKPRRVQRQRVRTRDVSRAEWRRAASGADKRVAPTVERAPKLKATRYWRRRQNNAS